MIGAAVACGCRSGRSALAVAVAAFLVGAFLAAGGRADDFLLGLLGLLGLRLFTLDGIVFLVAMWLAAYQQLRRKSGVLQLANTRRRHVGLALMRAGTVPFGSCGAQCAGGRTLGEPLM
jgi:hypothetical protein